MPSGGARARSGPGADPDSYRSQNREWIDLPAAGFAGAVPDYPLTGGSDAEVALWVELWSKPQAQAWAALGLKFQVAAYVRAYLESVEEKASAGLKTAVLRMESELGLSIMGMKQNLWRITGEVSPVSAPTAARKTSSGDWLKAVTVDGA